MYQRGVILKKTWKILHLMVKDLCASQSMTQGNPSALAGELEDLLLHGGLTREQFDRRMLLSLTSACAGLKKQAWILLDACIQQASKWNAKSLDFSVYGMVFNDFQADMRMTLTHSLMSRLKEMDSTGESLLTESEERSLLKGGYVYCKGGVWHVTPLVQKLLR